MFSPYVTLRSGGYLVINQTEALVAIDVNSGKATREFSIEETALNTNLEASDEIARQLKLRDLAGLIVIDFIDMEEKRNNRAVERRLKEALRFDRARIQVGRISHFGLMEMSRQRLRTGVLEGSTSQCPHCQGTGIIRSTESVALAVLRGLEDAIMAGSRTPLIATTTPSVALYILNNKRPFIIDMEARCGMSITVTGSDKMVGANFTVERGAAPAQPQRRAERAAVNMDWGFEDDDAGETADGGEPMPSSSVSSERFATDEDGGSRRRRRRRRRGGRRGGRNEGDEMGASASDADTYNGDGEDHGSDEMNDVEFAGGADESAHEEHSGNGEERRGGRNRRRGRRGGRRGRERREQAAAGMGEQPVIGERNGDAHREREGDPEHEHEHAYNAHDAHPHAVHEEGSFEAGAPGAAGGPPPEEPVDVPAAAPARRSRSEQSEARKSKVAEAAASEQAPEPAMADADTNNAPRAKRSHHRSASSEPRLERIVLGKEAQTEATAEQSSAEDSSAPTRKGWWQRRLGG
jgi:ribonuclease E